LGHHLTAALLAGGGVLYFVGYISGFNDGRKEQAHDPTEENAPNSSRVVVAHLPDPTMLSDEECRAMNRVMPPDGPVFKMIYRDASWEVTDRVICFEDMETDLRFSAFCYLREERRHFRADRCFLFYHPFTGEVFATLDDAIAHGESVRQEWVRRSGPANPLKN
jgi:hypothetical protein